MAKLTASTPAVMVLSFDLEDGDASTMFAELLTQVRDCIREHFPQRHVSVYAAIGSTAQHVNDITRHW